MTISTPDPKPSIRRVPAKAGADQILKILHEDGVVIIEKFCSPRVIEKLNHDVRPALDAYDENLPEVFAHRHGPHCKRINGLVAKSATVRSDLLNNPLVHDICRALYNDQQRVDYWMTSAMLLEHRPGGEPGPYHRDQNFFPLCKMLGAKGPLSLVNFFFALTDITAENGGTRVILGSHKWEDFDDHGSADMAVPMEFKAGDVCLLGGKTVHGSGDNITADSFRLMIIMGFQAGYLTSYEANALHLSRETLDSMTPLARRMVGWASPTIDTTPTWTIECGDIAIWRERQQRKLSG
ncbi:phytanoyl-CoA dioxygenase family protein [Aspergillus stella-maris]|uniref:phytanoyl-CoA dioxygenase family protein n=1 Tax=Aspergillus stella-maris TaxID=1810926 RepID=UPI003CCD6D0A